MAKYFATVVAKDFATLPERILMPRSGRPQPTEVELHILRILWELGPSPVREIHKRLAADRQTNYSTTVKMLSIMLHKGLVRRDERAQPHIYRAAFSRQTAGRRMLNDLIDKVYEGSAMSLVLQALSSRKATPRELEEIRRMLDRLEGEKS
jgi:predicted transcriptional regulator